MSRNTAGDGRTNGTTPASHFGKQVRKDRTRHGWSLADLSRVTKISAPHLSRIENGLSTPTERVALAMDVVFPYRHGWYVDFMNDYAEWAPPGYRSLGPYENAASRLWVWCPSVLHGLLQTEDYARALLATFPGVAEEMLKTRVRARMERQKRVLHRASPPVVCFLVDALSLLREVGSPEIMAAQMEHLLAVASMPDVTMHVVPAVGHSAATSGILVADEVAYAEHVGQGFTYTDDESVTELSRMISTIQADSYRASETLQMVERVRELWKRGVNPVTAVLTGETA